MLRAPTPVLTLPDGSSSSAALRRKQRTDNDAQSAVVLSRIVHRVIVRADEQHRRSRIRTCSNQQFVIQGALASTTGGITMHMTRRAPSTRPCTFPTASCQVSMPASRIQRRICAIKRIAA
jgi:hypothetical protein